MQSIQANIDEVVARSDLSGHTVFSFRHEGSMARMVAFLPSMPRSGERFSATGTWTDHPRFGRQFRAETFTVTSPACREEIVAFLASGLFPGIGEGLARRIVDHFGEQSLDVIEHRPKDLHQVSGFGAAKIAGVVAAWQQHSGLRDLALLLAPHGFSLSLASKVWRDWAYDAAAILAENPYRLYHDFTGASFRLVDRMALAQSPKWKDSLERGEAGIIDSLKQNYGNGHCCMPRVRLLAQARESLAMDPEQLERTLNGMIALYDVHEEEWEKEKLIYVPALRRAEDDAARQIASLSRGRALLKAYSKASTVTALATGRGFKLSPSQHAALQIVLSSAVSVLTGGPGTGKTRVTQLICDAARAAGVAIHLGAPTGRAARRLSDCSDLPASTIHRLLAYNPAFERFLRTADSPLPRGLVLIDEASMLDLPLSAHLLRAVAAGSQLVFVGDVDQLPSVGPGTVLRDMLKSMPLHTARLTEIHRQSVGSWIVRNAHGFLRGEPLSLPKKGEKADFMFRPASNDTGIRDLVSATLDRLRERKYNLITDVQVLSPSRKGPLGTIVLNKFLQQRINPVTDGAPTAHGLRVGDKVVQKSNDYEREVFNGHIGTVSRIDMDLKAAWILFEGKDHEYSFCDLDEVELAYALTAHKAQGGEFPIVICVAHLSHGLLLSRQLIYTAITRARSLLVLIGDEEAIEQARTNMRASERFGALGARLDEYLGTNGQRALLSA